MNRQSIRPDRPSLPSVPADKLPIPAMDVLGTWYIYIPWYAAAIDPPLTGPSGLQADGGAITQHGEELRIVFRC